MHKHSRILNCLCVRVYRQIKMPQWLHLRNNSRIDDINAREKRSTMICECDGNVAWYIIVWHVRSYQSNWFM